MKKFLLLLIASTSCASLMGMEEGPLPPAPPYSASTTAISTRYRYIPNDQYDQNQNVYIPQMVQNPDDMQLLEHQHNPIIMPRACVRYGLPTLLSVVSLVPMTIGCISDTACLPCDRTENPPLCYPNTRSLCYFLTCGSCGEID